MSPCNAETAAKGLTKSDKAAIVCSSASCPEEVAPIVDFDDERVKRLHNGLDHIRAVVISPLL